jgi:hypothetical protein
LLRNKLLVSSIVPTQLQEAISLAQCRVELDREREKCSYFIPKEKYVQKFIRNDLKLNKYGRKANNPKS